MKKLFDSVAYRCGAATNIDFKDTRNVKYDVSDGYDDGKPRLRLVFSARSSQQDECDFEIDISREDMVDILNDIVDEWPEIVDPPLTAVKEGIELIPTFS